MSTIEHTKSESEVSMMDASDEEDVYELDDEPEAEHTEDEMEVDSDSEEEEEERNLTAELLEEIGEDDDDDEDFHGQISTER